MIDRDDPEHLRRRRVVYERFTPRHVAKIEPYVRSIATDLAARASSKDEFDLVREIASPLPAMVICSMLGIPESDATEMQELSDRIVAGADGAEHVSEDVTEAYTAFVCRAGELIERRRAESTDDLMGSFVAAGLDYEDLVAEYLNLLVGGSETTRNVISGGLEALLRRPDQLALLTREPARIPVAVEECIRWVSPILNMARTATKEIELRGRTIPAGAEVLLMYVSANRDEEVFDDPETFDATREPNPHLSFGIGTHFCLGASLARLEIRVMFEEVLRAMPDLALADPDAEPRMTSSSFIRGITKLLVRTEG